VVPFTASDRPSRRFNDRFTVPTRADLDAGTRLLHDRAVEHGPIPERVPLGLSFLAFFDLTELRSNSPRRSRMPADDER
jgi:hypothetical protein